MKSLFASPVKILFFIITALSICEGETYTLSEIAQSPPFGNSISCRRPMAGGLYSQNANKTFVCWGGKDMNPVVREYDHSGNNWEDPVVVGDIPYGKTNYDYHDYPHIIRAHDGYLHVFFAHHTKELFHSVSNEPDNSGAGWDQETISQADGAGYPMPVVAENGDIYVYYRNQITSTNRPTYFVKSTDNGKTWSDQIPAIIHDQPRNDDYNEIYLGSVYREPAANGRPEQFMFVWTLAGCNRHNADHINIYAAAFRPGNGKFYSPSGDDLGSTVNADESEDKCLVHESSRKCYNWQTGHTHGARLTDTGNWVVIYSTNSNNRYWMKCSYYQNGNWTQAAIGGAENQNSNTFYGIDKFGSEHFRVYYAYGDNNQVKVAQSTDGGATWEEEATISKPEGISQAIVVDNYHNKAKLLLTSKKDDKSSYPGDGKVWIAEAHGVTKTNSHLQFAPSVHKLSEMRLYDFRGRKVTNIKGASLEYLSKGNYFIKPIQGIENSNSIVILGLEK